MTFEEILKRSESERYEDKYPNIFQDDCGLDIEWEPRNLRAIPSWGYRKSNMVRRATVMISSFRVVSIGAIHYYATIDVQGVNMVYKDNPSCSTWILNVKDNIRYLHIYMIKVIKTSNGKGNSGRQRV